MFFTFEILEPLSLNDIITDEVNDTNLFIFMSIVQERDMRERKWTLHCLLLFLRRLLLIVKYGTNKRLFVLSEVSEQVRWDTLNMWRI
jgi:hypothetical protein